MKRLVLAFCCLCHSRRQQTRRRSEARLTDGDGSVGCGDSEPQVKATESATASSQYVTTSEGAFSLQDIPLGFYKVSVTASGFPVLHRG